MNAEFPITQYIETDEYKSFSEALKFLDVFSCGVSGFAKTPMNDCERAVISIASNAISIIHSANLLVRNGYFVSTKILLRPLIERIAILSCVSKNEVYLASWYEGWNKSAGPKNNKDQSTFDALVMELNDYELIPGETRTLGQVIIDDYKIILNSETHGSFNSVGLNKTSSDDAYAAGPNSDNLTEFKVVVQLLILFMMQLQFEIYNAVPRLLKGSSTS